ncbi:unnamed protein product, partial [Prorocentrum cordatum]
MGALVTQSEPRQEISPADAPAALRGIPAVPRPAGLARQLAAQGACVREGCAVRLEVGVPGPLRVRPAPPPRARVACPLPPDRG